MRKRRSLLAVCLAASSTMSLIAAPGLNVMAAYTDPDASLEREAVNAAISQKVATEGMVLLDNSKGALPITGGQVALYGPGSYDTIRGGTGSGATYLRNNPVTVWQGFKDSGVTIVNDDYVNKMNDIFEENGGFNVNVMGNGYIQSEIMFDNEDKAAVEAVDPSVPAVYVISRTSAEGADHTLTKGDYYLTDAEYQNLKTLGAHFDNVIVVINTGCVIDTSFYNGIGTPDYEAHDITAQIHDVTYEPGVYYVEKDGEYQLSEDEYQEGTVYYSATEDYIPAAVTAENFKADGSLYTAELTYVEANIANASDLDPSKTYYNAVTDEEGNTQYNAVVVDAINFAQFDNLYYGENAYNPVEGEAVFNARGTYYQKGGYIIADVASTFKEYMELGCLYVKDGDQYRLVTSGDQYDEAAVYSEGWNVEKIDGLTSLVFMGQGGMNGGIAAVDCLLGNANFSGKTTDTWAANFRDYPSAAVFSSLDGDTVDENYVDDIYVGYRYFDTYGVEPAYPFGFGLSYTDFSIHADSVEVTPETVTVNATVTNTGDTAGKEVVEVYFSAPEDTDIDMPFQELAGFAKTSLLDPGASETVCVSFATSDLSSYHEAAEAYVIEDGAYTIRVGNSSRNTIEAGTITVDEDIITEQCKNVFTLTKENMKAGTYDASATMSSEAYAIEDMLTGSDIGITPTTEGLTADVTETALTKAEYPEAIAHTYGEGKVTAYVGADSDYEAKDNETLETVEISGDGSYTLVDVADGVITLEQLVADMSPIELIDLVQGESYEGIAASSKDSDILGYAADIIYSSCGGTTSNMYNSRYIPNVETVDGGAGVRINNEFQIYDPVPVDAELDADTTYYTCTFSAWGGSKYDEITFADQDEFRNTLESGTRLYTTDGVTGYQYCSATPVGTVISQTWNPELAEEQGRAVATEMLEYGATLWLAPGMNIHRNVLCGRNFEYYSEDPALAGNMVTAITKGVMYKEDGTESGVSTMPKHFAVNSQENDRFGGNNMASERAIREIYLTAFEKVSKEAQPYALMSCYNQINGVPGYNNYALLTEVLVNEWGFEGFVCTDWLSYYGSANCAKTATSAKTPATGATAYDSGSAYGVTGDDAYKTQAWQLSAGNSLEMPGQNEEKTLTGWENGEIRLGDLQHCALQILSSTMRSYQFEKLQEKLEAAGR